MDEIRIRSEMKLVVPTYIHQVTDDIFINLVIVPECRPRQILQIGWQVLKEPAMPLDFAEGNSFDRIGLKHAFD